MEVKSFYVDGIKVFCPSLNVDARGYFSEIFRKDDFTANCGDLDFVQENQSLSKKEGTVRGLHFQIEPHAQGKLVRCTSGAIFDVAVDIRRNSPTFRQWVSYELNARDCYQIWVPPGFAHGFCTLEPDTVIAYKVTDYYSAECDKGLAWDDPAIGITWPDVADAETLSPKDRKQPLLADLPAYFSWSN